MSENNAEAPSRILNHEPWTWNSAVSVNLCTAYYYNEEKYCTN